LPARKYHKGMRTNSSRFSPRSRPRRSRDEERVADSSDTRLAALPERTVIFMDIASPALPDPGSPEREK
jgi:hypothetical protein